MQEVKTLLSLQRRFKKVICGEESVQKKEGSWLRDAPPVTLETRVGIYQYAYWARIEESLQEDFLRVRKVMGEKKFTVLSKKYITNNPSRFSSLAEVSRDFPDFISKQKISLTIPYLSDLAQMEWLENLSFLTEDPLSNLNEMGNLSEEKMQSVVFILHPSLQLLKSKYSVHRKEIIEKTTRLILYRQNGRVVCRKVSQKQMRLIQAILKRKTLSELERLTQKNKIITTDMAKWFGDWTTNGLIVGFETKGKR